MNKYILYDGEEEEESFVCEFCCKVFNKEDSFSYITKKGYKICSECYEKEIKEGNEVEF